MSSDLGKIKWEEILLALRDFPRDGRPPSDTKGWVRFRMAESYGLVEEKVSTEPCRTCGTERAKGSYYQITPTGRLFLQVASELADRREEEAR